MMIYIDLDANVQLLVDFSMEQYVTKVDSTHKTMKTNSAMMQSQLKSSGAIRDSSHVKVMFTNRMFKLFCIHYPIGFISTHEEDV